MAVPPIDTGSVDIEELVRLAETTAREAGGLLRDGRERARATVESKSSPTDAVTELDRASEDLIRDRLLAARPDDALLGEEGGARTGRSGLEWVVDPLDGTVNYLYGLVPYAVSIAARLEGQTIVGVVHEPASGDTFVAARGRGAFRNGTALAMRRPPGLAEALVGTGFSYQAERRRVQAGLLRHVLPALRDIRRGGSAAADLCAVADGRLDGFFEAGLHLWDVAAGALLVEEAGGEVRWWPDLPPAPTVVAGPASVVDALGALLEAAAEREAA